MYVLLSCHGFLHGFMCRHICFAVTHNQHFPPPWPPYAHVTLSDSKPRVDRLLPTCVTGHVMHVVRGVSRDGDYPWNGAQKPVCTEIDFILRWHFKMKIYRCGCSLCLKRFSFTNTQPPSLTSQCAWDTVCAAFKNLTRLFMKACDARGRETHLWLVISSTFISLSSVYSPWRLNTC